MRKADLKYIIVLVIALALAVVAEMVKPEPLDWTASYERNDTRPYGCLVLFDLVADLFPRAEMRTVTLPPYLFLQSPTPTYSNYLFITDSFASDLAETDALLDYVAQGNTVFIAAQEFSGFFADTLLLETASVWLPLANPLDGEMGDSLGINLVNPLVRAEQPYYLQREEYAYYFEHFDTARGTVLGIDNQDHVNYIRVDIGGGALYLSTVPSAFTNYQMLAHDNAEYAYRSLSYLPDQEVRWDAYYKPQRADVTTPLRFVLREPSLKAAFWVLMTLVLLFILFEAKRKQRIIPVIAPLRNTTVEFVKIVGQLYYQHADHGNLAGKKITYFLDYIRQHLRLSTREIDEDFLERVAERSGVPGTEVRTLFAVIRAVQRQSNLSETELRRLSTAIDGFYRKSKR